jgi:hypothetical protein
VNLLIQEQAAEEHLRTIVEEAQERWGGPPGVMFDQVDYGICPGCNEPADALVLRDRGMCARCEERGERIVPCNHCKIPTGESRLIHGLCVRCDHVAGDEEDES